MRNKQVSFNVNPSQLEVYKYLFSSIAEEMGAVLQKSSFSANIKERRDFSCALFDADGNMIAQAAHIPVHLGSMPLTVRSAIDEFSKNGKQLLPGDTIILNDPFLGGTHLPDITLVTPVFIHGRADAATKVQHTKLAEKHFEKPFAFVASRAHHSDVGGFTPGSMPLAREIYQEGLIIPPIKLLEGGQLNLDLIKLILANVRIPEERFGDLQAQIASNQRGEARLRELVQQNGKDEINLFFQALLSYTERMTRQLIRSIPDGTYCFTDRLDNNGITAEEVPIKVCITIDEDQALVDFTGSAAQQEASVNAVYAITLSAVNYVFRSLIGLDVPNNSGCLRPIHIIAPEGSIVNAKHPAPVAGGNVETSQRIVDVLLGALSRACPEKIPAASQGTMNNVSIGGWDPERNRYFTYYETIGGGAGASSAGIGASAIHTHMTNTLNTPVEALEFTYPFRVTRYEIRKNSGGAGKYAGGEGIIREIELLTPAQVTLLTDRRITAPYGLNGGCDGETGSNKLIHSAEVIHLPSKGTILVSTGDILSISTPGGGGFGKKDESIS